MVIPLLVANAIMPTAQDLPEGLRQLAFRNFRTVRQDPDFHHDMNRLIQELAEISASNSSNDPQSECEDLHVEAYSQEHVQMKYYLYVSRLKVELLYPQIPQQQRRKLAAKLAVEITPDDSQGLTQEALFAKTKIVVCFLEEQGLLGRVDEPHAYFKGELLLQWGRYLGSNELVYFGGTTEKTIVGLGGSLNHVIGQVGASCAESSSATPALVNVLSRELGLGQPERSPFNLAGRDPTSMALAAVELASRQMAGPAERIEFVARKLLCWPENGVEYSWRGKSGLRVLLGTPIYASLVDANRRDETDFGRSLPLFDHQ